MQSSQKSQSSLLKSSSANPPQKQMIVKTINIIVPVFPTFHSIQNSTQHTNTPNAQFCLQFLIRQKLIILHIHCLFLLFGIQFFRLFVFSQNSFRIYLAYNLFACFCFQFFSCNFGNIAPLLCYFLAFCKVFWFYGLRNIAGRGFGEHIQNQFGIGHIIP